MKIPEQYFYDLYNYAKAWGLVHEAASGYAGLGWIGAHFGKRALPIVSGYRDPERTRELQRQWDMGNKEGLVVRPASRSRHHSRRAFDLAGSRQELLDYGQIALYIPGMRWGGTWKNPDIVHFDV